MDNLSTLIGAAVAAKMTPDFIEKEVNTRIDKLIVESVDKALRTWSDTGKLIEKAIEDALRVDRIDLPSYGVTVAAMVKGIVDARTSELIAGRLAEDVEELLKLAPKTVKLSEIAADMLKDKEGYGPVITVIVHHSEYGSTWVYLDEEEVIERHNKYRCRHRLHIDEKTGKIIGAYVGERELKRDTYIGRAYGLEQRIRAYVACGTIIEIDEDCVVTSVGDY